MNKFETAKYNVSGREGYTLSTALRLWKTKYRDLKQFKSEVCKHPSLEDFYNFVAEMWDGINPITVEEALKIANAEDRRTYFDCIGPERLFKEMDAKRLDKQVIKKKRTRWDDKNDSYEYEFEDIYELYKIPANKMFEKPKESWMRQDDVFAVRCWCTTTNREYWLFVPESSCSDSTWEDEKYKKTYDAVKGIAWTIRINISDPERIYRQGDIIVVKAGPKSEERGWNRHLTKDEYLELMYSES